MTTPMPYGWYPDVNDPSLVRLWDGYQWTLHTAPAGSIARPQTGSFQSEPRSGHRAARSPNRRRPLILIAVVLVLLIGGGIVGVTVLSSGGSKKIQVRGTFLLADTSTAFTDTTTSIRSLSGTPGQGGCEGSGGYSDIAAGTEVIITDDVGKTLVITGLSAGSYVSEFGCSFTFAASVPAGKKFYGVTVSHRGIVKEQEASMTAPELTLGS